jgi:metal-dependent amidase/aminoacylase/carboxypeptidase family protein
VVPDHVDRAFHVVIPGKGGHTSALQDTIDPVVTACHVAIRLQIIARRETNPNATVVVSCATLHTGDTSNVIPDRAELTVDIRAFSPEVLRKAVESMKRIIKAECDAFGIREQPTIQETEDVPPLINSSDVMGYLREEFGNTFGDDMVQDISPDMASDDFSILAPDYRPPLASASLASTSLLDSAAFT